MKRWYDQSKRTIAVMLLCLSGLLFLPFTSLQAEELTWQMFAGVYMPDLSVEENKGAPGSAFIFYASDYPPNTPATIYLNGNPIGIVQINSTGQTAFVVQTQASDPLGEYTVILASNFATGDDKSFSLEADEPVWGIPPSYEGAMFDMNGTLEPATLSVSYEDGMAMYLSDYSYNCGYEVHGSGTPYFTANPATLLMTMPAGTFYYTLPPATTTYYLVQPINCNGGINTPFQPVGEFQFTLTP